MKRVAFLLAAATVVSWPFACAQKKPDATSRSPSMANVRRFSVFQSQLDGHPLVAMIDMGLSGYREKSTVPWFLSISTPLVNPASDGLPTQADSNNLNEWEDTVERELKGEGRFVFVGRLTWNGHREVLYYLGQPETSTKKLQRLIDARSTRPFAFRCERDDKWEKVSIWLSQPRATE